MYILYLILTVTNGQPATIVSEHSSKATCEVAKDLIRESLSSGHVLLAKCTPK
jgi:hypothetical protein